jgi:hypothetical protein
LVVAANALTTSGEALPFNTKPGDTNVNPLSAGIVISKISPAPVPPHSTVSFLAVVSVFCAYNHTSSKSVAVADAVWTVFAPPDVVPEMSTPRPSVEPDKTIFENEAITYS